MQPNLRLCPPLFSNHPVWDRRVSVIKFAKSSKGTYTFVQMCKITVFPAFQFTKPNISLINIRVHVPVSNSHLSLIYCRTALDRQTCTLYFLPYLLLFYPKYVDVQNYTSFAYSFLFQCDVIVSLYSCVTQSKTVYFPRAVNQVIGKTILSKGR